MGILALLTAAINARALSLGDFGSLVLVQSAATLIVGLASFSTHLGIMRFGAIAVERDDPAALFGLVRLARRLDLGAGLIAGSIALACFGPVGGLLGFSQEMRLGMAYFAVGLLFSGFYSGLGLLRLQDRFEIIRSFEVGGSFFLLLAAVVLWAVDAPLLAYLAAYAIYVGGVPFLRYLVALRVLHRAYSPPDGPARLKPDERRAFIRFSLGSSVWASLELLRAQADTIIAGILFSNEMVGIFGAAKQVSGAVRRFSELASVVSFAEVGRLEARGEHRESSAIVGRVVRISVGVGVAAVLVTLVAGKQLLFYGFGPEFVAGSAVLVILMIGAALQFVFSPLIMYAQILRGARLPLIASIAGLVAFGGSILLLAGPFGLSGIAAGNVAFFIVAIAVVLASLREFQSQRGIPR